MPNHGNDGWQPTQAPQNITAPPKVAPAIKIPQTEPVMSLRDYIAIEMMRVISQDIRESHVREPIPLNRIARACYQMADEMMEARKNEKDKN